MNAASRFILGFALVLVIAFQVKANETQTRPLWGDLHVHSNFSFDSYSFGNTNLSPEHAYQFARGKPIKAHNGMMAKLHTPLDFLLVADHAEYLGVFLGLQSKDPLLSSSEIGRRWGAYFAAGQQAPISREYVRIIERQAPMEQLPEAFRASAWEKAVKLADQYNEPGKFTTLLGYEWTSMVKGNNLHRVVVLRDGSDRALRHSPFSALDSPNPEDLWQFLSRYEEQTGGAALSIPHNGNVSNGLMFAKNRISGEKFDAAYVELRHRFERLYEVTQVKGDAEAHPLLSPNDEFADFETWDQGNLRMIPKHRDMLEGEYARPALKTGLDLAARYGQNPFQFGLVGSTDSHTALSTADDNNFFGKFLDSEPSAQRTQTALGGRLWDNWRLSASGYTAVWAKENTREAIFDALHRREVYASSGPRINLRFFGGWTFTEADIKEGLVRKGYEKGVPMGGELYGEHGSGSAGNAAPKFLIGVLKDPNSESIDHVQIVKGWRDENGELHEKIHDVTPEHKSGLASAHIYWQDTEFSFAHHAFYYVRVIEKESPRWPAYDAKNFSLSLKPEIPQVTRERAYSSPIWYHPQGLSHD